MSSVVSATLALKLPRHFKGELFAAWREMFVGVRLSWCFNAMSAFMTEYEAPVSGRADTEKEMWPTDSQSWTLGQNI